MDNSVNQEIGDLVAHDLRPDEQLRWVGQPLPVPFALASLQPALRFAALLAGAAVLVYTVIAVLQFVISHTELPFLTSILVASGVFIIAFIAAMLYVFVRVYRSARTMGYAVTDQRAMIVYESPRLQIDSYGPYGVWEIEVQPASGNTAHVIFATHFLEDGYLNVGGETRGMRGMITRRPAIQMMKAANPALSSGTSSTSGVGFYAIRDADKVAELLHGTLKSGHVS